MTTSRGSATLSTIFATDAVSVTSQFSITCTPRAASSSLLERHVTTTLAPHSTSSLTRARPMPRLPPVTSTRWPFRNDPSKYSVVSMRALFSALPLANRAG